MMNSEKLLFIGSIIIGQMTETAWDILGEKEHEQVITQLRLPDGDVAIGAALILVDKRGTYIQSGGSLAPDQIYEVRRRIELEPLLEMARKGMPGEVATLLALYDDEPLQITLAKED